MTPKYKRGDLVRIATEPWTQHSGDLVLILKANVNGNSVAYDFTIPEQRGSVPEQMIAKVIATGIKIPEPYPSAAGDSE